MPLYLISIAGVGLLVANLVGAAAVSWWIVLLMVFAPLVLLLALGVGFVALAVPSLLLVALHEWRERRRDR